jgi:hypothetical protein
VIPLPFQSGLERMLSSRGDRGFESFSLHRRVYYELDFRGASDENRADSVST